LQEATVGEGITVLNGLVLGHRTQAREEYDLAAVVVAAGVLRVGVAALLISTFSE